MSKSEIKRIIESKAGYVYLKAKNESYVVICVSKDKSEGAGKETKFVQCINCGELLANNDGGHLRYDNVLNVGIRFCFRRHADKHKKPSQHDNDVKSVEIFPKAPIATKAEIKAMKSAISSMCFQHNLPYSIVEKQGFRNVLATAMEIGFVFSDLYRFYNIYCSVKRRSVLDIPSVLVDLTTIYRNVVESSNELKKAISSKLERIFVERGGCIGIDYGKRQKDYLCVVAYFLDENWYDNKGNNKF